MKNIVLIGMMGSGKTTVGQLVAGRLNRQLADIDAMIEARENMEISEIFATQGESYFRSVEMGMAQALSLREDLVIACGAGLPLQEGAMAALKQSGIVIWLNRDAGEIFDNEDLSDRPLAREGRDAFVRLAGELFFLLGEARRRWALSIYALLAISISLIPFRSYVAFLVQLSLTSSAFALGFLPCCDYIIHLF